MKKYNRLIAFVLTTVVMINMIQPVFAATDDGTISMDELMQMYYANDPDNQQVMAIDDEYNQDIIDEINNNSMISIYGEEESTDVESNEELMSNSIAENEANTESQDSEVSLMSTSSDDIFDNFKVEPVSSVYNVLNNNNDYVSQATGALTYEKELLTLPGVNGLDLDLSVQYNSERAVVTQNEFADASTEIRKINFNNFAVGWSFRFPTIIKSNVKNHYGRKIETSISFPDGSEYSIENDVENPSVDTTLNLQYYKLSDMSLVKKAGTNYYELTYINGTTYIFDGEYGNLIKIKDVYNNDIEFFYAELKYNRGSFLDYVFNPSYYHAKINVLTKIIDSAEREIVIDYVIDDTAYGKEIKQIEIKKDDTTYATLQLARMSIYEGKVDILSQIIDGEGNATKFNYTEKIAHIYHRNNYYAINPTYAVNGSVVALTKVELPTEGWIGYDYIKARRSYSYLLLGGIECDWYEVYKISRVYDSTGYERLYEYENDRSGYPYTYLDVEPIFPNGVVSGLTRTGNVNNSAFRYYCLMKEKGKTTVSTFDYQHNKIKEQTYAENNTQNSYMVGNGRTQWTVLNGDYIYHMGIRDSNLITLNNSLVFYKQNINTGETILLTPCLVSLWLCNVHVKSYGNYIYLFYGICSNSATTGIAKKFVAKSYDIAKDTWSDAGEIEVSSTIGQYLKLSNMYYTNGVFYSYAKETNGAFYHAVYNPSENDIDKRWEIKDSATVYINGKSNNKFGHVSSVGGKIYYKSSDCIVEYDLDTDVATNKEFNNLLYASDDGGFVFDNKTYCNNYTEIVEFDYSNGIIKNTYTLPDSLEYSEFFIQRGTDGNIYFITQSQNDSYSCPIYKFDPDTSYGFVEIGNLMVNPVIIPNHTISPVLFSGNNCIYVCGDGLEKIDLNVPSSSQSTGVVTTNYNAYNQPTSTVTTRISGSQEQNNGIESNTYITGKNIILSKTDILGNKTDYEYKESQYYIPTKITQYSGTENEIIINNMLSDDKTKIVSSTTKYDDREIKTLYGYDAIYPGNIVSEIVVEIKDGVENLLSEKEFIYDNVGLNIIQEKQKNVSTNNGSFELQTIPEITISYTYDHMGHLTSQTDAMGNVTSYTYNKNGWLLKTTYPDGTFVENTYSLSNGTNKITTSYNDIYTTVDYFDELGRQSKHCIIKSGSEIMQQQYGYANGNLAVVRDGLGNHKSYYYDAFDRITTVWEYGNKIPHMENTVEYDDFNLTKKIHTISDDKTVYYDNVGRVIAEEENTASGINKTQYVYNQKNELISKINGLDNSIVYEYNDMGQLCSVANEIGQITQYKYDKYGNVSSVTYPGDNYASYTYDNIGRVIKDEDALGNVQQYAYDKNGNLIAYKDKNGVLTTSSYDNMNRLTNTNSGNINIGYTYNEFGNVLTMKDTTGPTTYVYDDIQNLVSITVPDGKSVSYTYDIMNNVTGMKDYADNEYTYEYDGLYRIDKIYAGENLVADYTYEAYTGKLASAVYPEYTEKFKYDDARRIISHTIENSQHNIEYYYTYDILGNQTRVFENADITETQTKCDDKGMCYIDYVPVNYQKTTNYTYDKLNRLTSVQQSDGTYTAYTFDAGNNIMTKDITHPSSYEYSFKQDGTEHTINNISTHNYTYSYDKANHLMTSTESIAGTGDTYSGYLEIANNFTYDNNGNTLSKTTGGQVDESVVQYGYNELNQLTSYTDASGNVTNYGYDGTGMRVSKTQGNATQKFYWDRNYIVNEAVNNSITATNYVGVNGIFARKSSYDVDYLAKNIHGDVIRTIREKAGINTYTYTEYGECDTNQIDGAVSNNPFGYCGEYYDDESGLIYLRNRYYDPAMGRFITEDPVMDGNNWYVYCENNPINKIDPNGYDAIILTNEYAVNSADYTAGIIGDSVYFGHQGVLVQDEDNTWYYFSCGSNYVQFEKVDTQYMAGLDVFSNKYYGGGTYTASTYIKGDFSDSVKYYNNYYEANKETDNISSYNLITNNCTTVVMNGIFKGKLPDGTLVLDFIGKEVSAIPNVNKTRMESVFSNTSFTYDDYYQTINDQLWEARHGFWKNPLKAKKLEKLYY